MQPVFTATDTLNGLEIKVLLSSGLLFLLNMGLFPLFPLDFSLYHSPVGMEELKFPSGSLSVVKLSQRGSLFCHSRRPSTCSLHVGGDAVLSVPGTGTSSKELPYHLIRSN